MTKEKGKIIYEGEKKGRKGLLCGFLFYLLKVSPLPDQLEGRGQAGGGGFSFIRTPLGRTPSKEKEGNNRRKEGKGRMYTFGLGKKHEFSGFCLKKMPFMYNLHSRKMKCGCGDRQMVLSALCLLLP